MLPYLLHLLLLLEVEHRLRKVLRQDGRPNILPRRILAFTEEERMQAMFELLQEHRPVESRRILDTTFQETAENQLTPRRPLPARCPPLVRRPCCPSLDLLRLSKRVRLYRMEAPRWGTTRKRSPESLRLRGSQAVAVRLKPSSSTSSTPCWKTRTST